MTLDEKLKECRLQLGESLQDTATAIGISKSHVWEMETGKSSNPGMLLLKRLATHFGVTIAYLCGETPPSPDEDPEMTIIWNQFVELTPKHRRVVHTIIKTFRAIELE